MPRKKITNNFELVERSGYTMKFFDNESKGYEADVYLYGEVVESRPFNPWTGKKAEGNFIELSGFLKDFERLKTMDKVTFRINSVGGEVYSGIAIYNHIRELKGYTVTKVDGLAASAASVIFQAGEERVMNSGAQMMIHGASSMLFGYYNLADIAEVKQALESINNSIAKIYSNYSPKSERELLEAMKRTTWLTADEAVEWGLADSVSDTKAAERKVAVWNKNALMGMGMMLPVGYEWEDSEKEEDKTMDIKELKEKYPDLVDEIRKEVKAEADTMMNEAQAKAETVLKEVESKHVSEMENTVTEALKKDRERMKEIDSIADIVGDRALVEKAKYEDNMTAEQLALYAMKAQAKAGEAFLKKREADLKTAGVENVAPSANSGIEANVDSREQKMQESINLLKDAFKKGE